MRKLICAMMVAGLYAGATPVLAGDEPLCLECHEPAEDWKDLTTAQIIADAKAPDNKRHKDVRALSDEQLQAMVTALTQPK